MTKDFYIEWPKLVPKFSKSGYLITRWETMVKKSLLKIFGNVTIIVKCPEVQGDGKNLNSLMETIC